jgi:membrane-bound serine protease (ClpP class)
MENEVANAGLTWVNAGGVALLAIGFGLLFAEIFVPSFGLFGLAGIAAVLIGLANLQYTGYLSDFPLSPEALIGIAIIFIILSTIGGWYFYKLYKKRNTTGLEGMVGATARVLSWDGTKGRVFVQGENWTAYADETLKLEKDDEVVVAKAEELKIKIIPAHADQTNTSEKLI